MQTIEHLVYRLHHIRHPNGFQALSYSYFLIKFGFGLVDIFSVVFIFTLGYDLWSGLLLVAAFYWAQRLVVVGGLLPGASLIRRLGYRKSMLLSILMQAGRLGLLAMTTADQLWLLVPVAILGGIFGALYFPAYHGLFLDDGDGQRVGEQMGYLEMIGVLATVASPFVAGVVIANFGFSWLFGITGLLLIVSAAPLFMMPHHNHQGRQVGVGEIWELIKKNRRLVGVAFFWNWHYAISDFFWPLYVFLMVTQFEAVGSLFSLAMIASSVALYLFGKWYDRRQLKRIFPVVSLLMSVLWLTRFLTQSLFGLAIVEVLMRLISPAWYMKARRYELVKGEGMDSVSFGVIHELMMSLSKLTAIILAILLLWATQISWISLALPAIIGIMITMWLLRAK
jgi:MFS family permease